MIVKTPRRKIAGRAQHDRCQSDTGTNNNTDTGNDNDKNDGSTSDSGKDVDSAPPSPIPATDLLDEEEEDNDFLEPWSEWIKRATQHAENTIAKMGITDWNKIIKQRKWDWVRQIATSTTKEWARAALQWDPGRDAQTQTQRRVGRPKTRWWDDVLRHAQQMAGDPPKTPTDLLVCAATEEWEILKKGFIEQ